MSIKIYNSLSGKKEDFKPIAEGKVKMYVCGPTVYDVSHIGHLRAAYVFDIIRRYLQYRGYNVTFVRNITDVDDKIINRAREEMSKNSLEEENTLNRKVKEIAGKFTSLYEKDMEQFGIIKPDIQPRATEHIDGMIAMIKGLIDKGLAYESEGDVYFEVRKFSGYGKLSHQSIDEMMAGVRVEQGLKKKDPLDFALWKKAKPDEPSWKSPWGVGRPGWHIECSVMSTRYLGETFDIHGGGMDLIFPHHENEIAQAQGATGKAFANYWIHNGLLTVNKEKMAKSLGNFITIDDILKRTTPDALKILFLSTHYSHPVDYNQEKLKEKEKALEGFLIFFGRIEQLRKANKSFDQILKLAVDSQDKFLEKRIQEEIENKKASFMAAMDDNFNTAAALSKLYDLLELGNKVLDGKGTYCISTWKLKVELHSKICSEMKQLGAVLGLFQRIEDKQIKISKEEIEEKIELRSKYKKEKDFKSADAIRKELQEMGVILEDTKDGASSWRIKN